MLKAPLVVFCAVKRSQRCSHSRQKQNATELSRPAAALRTAQRPRPHAATAPTASRPVDAAPAPVARLSQRNAFRTRSHVAVQSTTGFDLAPRKPRSSDVQANCAAIPGTGLGSWAGRAVPEAPLAHRNWAAGPARRPPARRAAAGRSTPTSPRPAGTRRLEQQPPRGR